MSLKVMTWPATVLFNLNEVKGVRAKAVCSDLALKLKVRNRARRQKNEE